MNLSRFRSTESPKDPATTSDSASHDVSPERQPSGWSLRKKLIFAAAVTAAAVIAVVIGAVVGVKVNRYPDYAPLNYRLVDTYQGKSFFDKFDYFSAEDPTHGFVVYVDSVTAQEFNLTHASDSSAVLRVDASTPNAIVGRNSVRIESKATYDTGLFMFDIVHTPYGCGTWPALWLTDGYNWPENGEIDVLESTNGGSHGNEITLHSTDGCSMDVKRKLTGEAVFQSCDNSTHGNAGCGVIGHPATYGEAMNANGGGVYALELRAAGVRAWFFPRDALPADVASEDRIPDPSSWGTALADFPSTKCDIGSHFRNQSIIANIALCGELAALPQYYDHMYNCPATCPEFVAENPDAFEEAYWEFKSFKVYQAT